MNKFNSLKYSKTKLSFPYEKLIDVYLDLFDI